MTDNPHDALFQITFSNPENAAGLLRQVLPPALSARVDFSTLALRPGNFVDPELDGHRADLLFSARIDGREALLYLLFEHQSYEDRFLLLRLLEYMSRIWREWLDANPSARRIPLIVPVVLHHSRGGWRMARRFDELFDADAALLEAARPFVPGFGFVLDDISDVDDDALSRRAISLHAALVLSLLRRARSGDDFFLGLDRWASAFVAILNAPNGAAAIRSLLEYIHSVTKRPSEEVVMAIREVVGQSAGYRIIHASEVWAQEAELRGEQKGELRGELRGRQSLLRRQLERRFGALPSWADEVLRAADAEALTAMGDRILDAPTLEDVLGTNQR